MITALLAARFFVLLAFVAAAALIVWTAAGAD